MAVLDDVMQAIGAYSVYDDTGVGQFDVSDNGVLVYLRGGQYPARSNELVWVDRRAVVTPLPFAAGAFLGPRVSPDGQRIAFFARRGPSAETDIWVYSIERQNTTRLTVQGTNSYPVWSPDSRSLVFFMETSAGRQLGRAPADGSAGSERLTTSENDQLPASWASTTNELAFLEVHRGQAENRLWILPMAGDRKPRPVLQAPNPLTHPEFSPDGRWLAYVSRITGSAEVYVRAYPDLGDQTRISTDGDSAPLWAHSGRELFFLHGSSGRVEVMVCDIDTSKGFRASKPRMLFDGPYVSTAPFRSYDISPDDQRLLMVRQSANPESPFTQMRVVLNWFDEVKARAAAK